MAQVLLYNWRHGESSLSSKKAAIVPLWKCLYTHFYDFIREYTEKHEKKYGFLKPAVEEVVNKYLDCGNLTKGFARLHCDKCNKDYLLAFSCKGRWFCPKVPGA